MAKTVLMPKQGNTVESCILLEWKKQEGDSIEAGEVLCEAETDKATIEVESTASGTVLKLLYEPDDEVPVQQPIAVIGEAGEDISDLVSQPEEAGEPQPEQKQQKEPAEEPKPPRPAAPAAAAETGKPSPRARRRAADQGVDLSGLPGTGPRGRVIERDVTAAAESRQPMTPAAAERAAAEGLQAPAHGTGIGGRIRFSDLHAPETADVTAAGEKAFPGPSQEVPLKSIRKITAQRMHESLQQTAQLSMTASADASALLAFRRRCKESPESLGMRSVTINDLILFAVSRTLTEHRYMNAHFLGDKTVEYAHAHIGIAVDAPKGLMVPVLTYADQRSLVNLSQEAKGLTQSCIDGKAAPELFEGGTFTVTNLGALGIEHFTPVLNTPQTAILGVNTVTKRPVEEEDGEILLKPYISFSLTFDHQAVDGAPAARFLRDLVRAVESIDLLVAK